MVRALTAQAKHPDGVQLPVTAVFFSFFSPLSHTSKRFCLLFFPVEARCSKITSLGWHSSSYMTKAGDQEPESG